MFVLFCIRVYIGTYKYTIYHSTTYTRVYSQVLARNNNLFCTRDEPRSHPDALPNILLYIWELGTYT